MNMVVLQLLLLLLSLLFICVYLLIINPKTNNSVLTNWPLLGMTPSLLMNAHRIHDFFTDILLQSSTTFQLKGPLFANMDMLVTSDPANVNYMLSKNFSNYPKGPEFRKNFDILGDGVFNADGDLWDLHHKTTLSLFNHAQFSTIVQEIVGTKLEKGLIPLLDKVSKHGIQVDLQEIFQRLTLDNILLLVCDHDLLSLTVDLPHIPFEKSFAAAEEAILYRHVLPEVILKLQRWIGFGKEKGLRIAMEDGDEIIYKCISMKRQALLNRNSKQLPTGEEEYKLDLLTAYMEAYKGKTKNPDKFLRDTLLNLMVAGRDTTSTALTWFFWLLSKNPSVESKILEEMEANSYPKEDERSMSFTKTENVGKLVYLHGALCEALRLFPPVPLNHKSPQQADILPSGHRVDKGTKIVLSFYSMGRMESIWGKDCLEFKPERWISEKGGIIRVPSYKFPAFNAGPRTCLGKEMSFTQMKMVTTRIIRHYKIEVVEGHSVVPADSVILQMKYGLKVRVAKRTAA